jgi:hypothetical protein
MRRSAILILGALLLLPRLLHSQDPSGAAENSASFDPGGLVTAGADSSDWSQTFGRGFLASPEFNKLRRYRDEKRSLLTLLENRLKPAQVEQRESSRALEERNAVVAYLARLDEATKPDSASVYIFRSLDPDYDLMLGVSTPGAATFGRLREVVRAVNTKNEPLVARAKAAEQEVSTLNASIRTVREDLARSEDAMDSALRSENRTLWFKVGISAFFSILIGLMIFRFFQAINQSSDATLGGLLLSDGGLQFVTIFVLIIAIILFGILNILEGRELAAIISGIAGYILGRGTHGKPEPAARGPAGASGGGQSPIIQTANAVIPDRQAPPPAADAPEPKGAEPRREPAAAAS